MATSRSPCGTLGPGIAPEDQALIFEEFQQVDNSSTRQKGGTGLGLAISKRYCRNARRNNQPSESAPGSGSTFRMRIPIRCRGALGSGMSKRILMVEDTEDNSQIVRDLMATTEYELIEAADGVAGVDGSRGCRSRT